MASIRFSVLDVGQGTGNLLEYFEGADTSKPSQAILIDLGSSQQKETLGVSSAKYVATRLRAMGTPATLEAVFLSHPDKDHVNLTADLLDEFTFPQLTINNIFYGADRHGYLKYRGTKRQIDFLAKLDEYRPVGTRTVLKGPGIAESGIRDKDQSKWKPIATMGANDAVKVYLIVGNTLYGSPDKFSTVTSGPRLDGYRKNSASLMLLVRYEGQDIVVTGDATGLTMSDANAVLRDRQLKAFSLTLPHHGSYTSAVDLRAGAGKTTDDDKVRNLKTFIKAISPRTISASAWEYGNYRHPHITIVDAFADFLSATGIQIFSDPTASVGARNDLHFMTAWFSTDRKDLIGGGKTTSWPSANGWYTVRTGSPVFTTDYFNPGDGKGRYEYPTATPPSASVTFNRSLQIFPWPKRAIAWAFEVAGTNLQVRPVHHKKSIAALPRSHPLRMAAGPLPEEDDFVILPVVAPEDVANLPPPPVRPADEVHSRAVPPPPPRGLRAVI
jgi:beta-lactamase superfamily II metal-dependent hydrolase